MSIVIRSDKVEEINRTLQEKINPYSTKAPLISLGGNGYNRDTDCVQRGIMVICHLDDLSQMIKELEVLRDAIAEHTGVML